MNGVLGCGRLAASINSRDGGSKHIYIRFIASLELDLAPLEICRGREAVNAISFQENQAEDSKQHLV